MVHLSTSAPHLLRLIAMDVCWLRHNCLPLSSNRLFILHNSSFSKFLSSPFASPVRDAGAGVVDTPHHHPLHLPQAQLVQGRDLGSVGGEGRILPRERPQGDDVLALVRAALQRGIVLAITVPHGALARQLQRDGPPFQGKVSPSFLFPLSLVITDRPPPQQPLHPSHRHLGRSLSNLRHLPVWFTSNLGFNVEVSWSRLACYLGVMYPLQPLTLPTTLRSPLRSRPTERVVPAPPLPLAPLRDVRAPPPVAVHPAIEETQSLSFPLVWPQHRLFQGMSVADVTAPDQYRGHLLDAIEPEGLAAQVGVSVTVPIPVTMEGKVVDEDITDIALLGLELLPPRSTVLAVVHAF